MVNSNCSFTSDKVIYTIPFTLGEKEIFGPKLFSTEQIW